MTREIPTSSEFMDRVFVQINLLLGETSIQGLIRNFDARFERNWNGGFSVGLFDLFTGVKRAPRSQKRKSPLSSGVINDDPGSNAHRGSFSNSSIAFSTPQLLK